MNKGYVWYSTGSSETGEKLAAALGFDHGKKTPNLPKFPILFGWGCKAESREKYDPAKVDAAIENGSLRVLNHPKALSSARNKLGLLTRLREAGHHVPGFVSIKGVSAMKLVAEMKSAVDDGVITFPCVGFNETHRGKPMFCWTMEDLNQILTANKNRARSAIKIDYVRSLVQGTEYRIHVFRDEGLCAEVKVLANDPTAATAASLLTKLKKRQEKTEVPLNATQDELQFVVSQLASDLVRGPSHMLRSVQHGWEMKPIAVGEVPAEVVVAAINALDTAGLDVGAVSVEFIEGSAVISNVVSAPGLSEEQVGLYVAAIKSFSKAGGSKKVKPGANKAVNAGEGKATREIIGKITRKVRLGDVSQKQAEAILESLG